MGKERKVLCEKIFEHYVGGTPQPEAEEEGEPPAPVIYLAGFDPPVDRLMNDFKRHAVLRYGSLVEAFMAWDPEANGTVSHKRFIAACHEIKLVHGIHRLLEYLDPEFDHKKLSMKEEMEM